MKTKKILRNTLLIAGIFVLALIILAEIFKDDMVKIAIERGVNTFDVPLGVGEVDFSLLYRFPYATIEFNDIVMFSEEPSDFLAILPDTIAGISKLYASVDMVALMKGNILVKKIEIDDVKAKYMVDSLGNSNFDFLLNAPADTTEAVVDDTTKVQGVYSLDKLELSNIQLDYVDSFLNATAQVYISNLEMNGKVQPEGFMAATEGEVFVRDLTFQDYQLETLNNSQLKFNITALNDTVAIHQFNLAAGSSNFNITGSYFKTDSAQIDVQLMGQDIDLAENLSILPQKMIDEYKLSNVSGKLNVEGTAKGFLTPHSVPDVDVNLNLSNGRMKYDQYPQLKNIMVDTRFVSGKKDMWDSAFVYINKFYAETGQSYVELEAKLLNAPNINYDVSAKVNADFNDFKEVIPDSLINELSGGFEASLSTSGIMPDSIDDQFVDYALDRTQMNFSARDISLAMDSLPQIKNLSGSVAYQPRTVKLNDLKMWVPDYGVNLTNAYLSSSFDGKVSNYEEIKLKVDSLLLNTTVSSIYVAGEINGLKNVDYNIKTELNIGLSEWMQAVPDSLVNNMSGRINAKLNSAGQFNIDSVADKAMALLFEGSELSVETNNLTVQMEDTLASIHDFSSNISLLNDSLSINEASGTYNSIAFNIDSAYVLNLYKAFFQNNKEEILVKGNYHFGDVDYAFFLPFMEEDSVEVSESSEKQNEVQNWTYKFQGKVSIDKFKYGKALFENISTKAMAIPDYYVVDYFNVDAFGGDLNLSAKHMVHPDDGRSVTWMKTKINKMNIHQLMKDFDDFEEYYDPMIRSEQVYGVFSTEMDIRVVLNSEYEPYMDSLMLAGDLALEEGALKNVEAIMAISEIKGHGLKDLDNMRFKTLKSSLFLYKNYIWIPKTDILSSSFDATFLGMHSFEEEYSYHIRVMLRQILSGNVKDKFRKQNSEGGFSAEDKGRYYVSSYIDGKPKAWFDNKRDRRLMSTKIRLNNNAFLTLFNPSITKYNTGVK
ncbi:hypothetical protein E9993_07905 [Labilibacter sediminis]|nr:hypothetical protein E9993_07905 [Labilibacter sediminis]